MKMFKFFILGAVLVPSIVFAQSGLSFEGGQNGNGDTPITQMLTCTDESVQDAYYSVAFPDIVSVELAIPVGETDIRKVRGTCAPPSPAADINTDVNCTVVDQEGGGTTYYVKLYTLPNDRLEASLMTSGESIVLPLPDCKVSESVSQ